MKLLVIEDDPEVAAYILKGFKESGHSVDLATNGKDGLFQATTEDYDILIVDRMLPQPDGLTIIKTLRGAENATPVLILSALGDVDDRVQGLRAGSDDYLVKPFAFAELHARVEALHRRAAGIQQAEQYILQTGDLQMDILARKVRRGNQEIPLQSREFSLLEYLLRHQRQVVTRTMLLEKVWDYHFDPQTNVIDVHISRLRQKIDKDFDKPLIKTIRGAGYVLDAD